MSHRSFACDSLRMATFFVVMALIGTWSVLASGCSPEAGRAFDGVSLAVEPTDLTLGPDHELLPDALGRFDQIGLGCSFLVNHELDDPGAVAKIDEDQLSEIPLLVSPAGQHDPSADIFPSECSCLYSACDLHDDSELPSERYVSLYSR